jgi:crotonobetainyl-CoA:carnitine CoA-transferase CaiB-like acyl-CoA transferase
LNPRLIVANLSGYGRNGPEKDLPGYEGISYFSRSGIMHTLQVPGLPPPQYPVGMCDFPAGMVLAYGIMLALFIRERTQGDRILMAKISPLSISPLLCSSYITYQEEHLVCLPP